MIKLYGYKKCGTCHKAEKWLQEAKLDYTYIDITEDGVPRQVLLLALLQGIPLKRLFNTSGVVYKEDGWRERWQNMSQDVAIDALVGNGKLCKRPILTDGKQVTVGFTEGTFGVWK